MGQLHDKAKRLLLENGAAYNVYHDHRSVLRTWDLDMWPLVIIEAEWLRLEQGLKQRYRLLERLFADLYGAQDVIRNGLLPAELVFAHNAFSHPCHQLPLTTQHALPWYSVDLARDTDGRFLVLGDHLQKPAGFGYALENRQIMARLLRNALNEHQVRLLRPFFATLRTNMTGSAFLPREDPQTVLLTSGPQDPLYFEHTFLANYLGLTLVQGEDLATRSGRVCLKTLDGLHTVDVIVRLIDDRLCDPLELQESSCVGVAGLLQAIRNRRVAVVNPPGAAVLENQGLLAWLPQLARYFLGEELLLPSTPTWWCGQRDHLAYTLDHLDMLVIKSLDRLDSAPLVFGDQLSSAEQLTMRQRILAQPSSFIAQKRITPSTIPVMSDHRLVPGHMLLRTFMTAGVAGVEVMPGGLATVSTQSAQVPFFDNYGGITKDVWVLSSLPVARGGRQPSGPLLQPSIFTGELSSRVAENLFWLGRYAVRVENILRLLRTILLLPLLEESDDKSDAAPQQATRILYQAATLLTATLPGFMGVGSEQCFADPEPEIRRMILSSNDNGSVRATVKTLIQTAYRVRDRLSSDTWRIINRIHDILLHLEGLHHLNDMVDDIEALLTSLTAFTGLSMENMTRGTGWRFLELGRRLERSLFATELFQITLVQHTDADEEQLLLEALLNITDSIITYRRRYRSHLAMKPTLDLILQDESNPRSLSFQLVELQQHIDQLPQLQPIPVFRTPAGRTILEAVNLLRLADTDLLALINDTTMKRPNLEELLVRMKQLLPLLSAEISNSYFQHALPVTRQGMPLTR
ncbi:MAG: circularly permuted type 2 ATP-grasp protein [Magnetococcales bacterium]|nr:circularly permuted type 2 ATP-grasp protein [Magnetococcales bacterium]